MSNVDKILSDINKIKNPKDLKKIKTTVDFKLKSTESNEEYTKDDEQLFFDLICRYLKSKGMTTGSFTHFKRTNMYNTFSRNFEYIKEFSENNFSIKNKRQKLSLYSTLSKILVDALTSEDYGVPDIRTISSNMLYISNYFDKSFPGYLRSGLADLVVDKK